MTDKKLSAYDVLSEVSKEDLIVALKSLGEGKYQNANIKMSKMAEALPGVPAGSIICFAGVVEHLEGYIWCNGQAVSRSEYPKLFAAIREVYGKGDGVNTFNVPDFRGCFLRGCGGNSNQVGQIQYDAIRNIVGDAPIMSRSVSGGNAFREDKTEGIRFLEAPEVINGTRMPERASTANLSFDASRVVPVANENRPINFAVHYYIKY
jgi:microcystin-dependent protein